ncbi:MAG TPA: thioredoxin domain-containing protein [Parachlamydiaceae bacterium]|nr:thioredoxin domain-containing protein [Parachlamydiaceae bacterium]
MSASTQRLILIATVLLMILFVLGNFFFTHIKPTSEYSLNTFNQPTLGNTKASVELVVFEDPKCASCKLYNSDIFPAIKKEYIDTNKIKYVNIPVSLMENSMDEVEALLCVYYQDEQKPSSELFFKLLHIMYGVQGEKKTVDQILEIAKKEDPAFNLDKIKKCIERHVYFTKIKQNTAEALRTMSNNKSLPALFINGVRIDASNSETIFKAIDKASSK